MEILACFKVQLTLLGSGCAGALPHHGTGRIVQGPTNSVLFASTHSVTTTTSPTTAYLEGGISARVINVLASWALTALLSKIEPVYKRSGS